MESGERSKAFRVLVRGAGFAFLGLMLGKVFSFLFNFIAARLGSEQYGLLSLGFAIFQVTVTFSILGLRRGVVRYVAFYRSQKDEGRLKGTITSSLKMGCAVAFIFSLIMFFFSDYIASFFNPNLSPILKILAFLLPFYAASDFFLNVMVAFEKNKYSVFVKDFLEKLIKVALAAIFISLGYGLYGAVAAFVIAILSTFVLSFAFMEKKVYPLIKTKVKSIEFKKILIKFSLPLLLSGVMTLIVSWTDVLMLGFFRTTSEVGIYNAALITAGLLIIFPTSLSALFLPIITKFHGKNMFDDFREVFKRTSKWIFVLNVPVFLFLIVFPTPIQEIIFGKEYGLGSLALVLLVLGYFWHSFSFTCSQALHLLKKTNIFIWITLLAAVLNIGINYLLIPKFGMVGGAIATSISFIASSSLMVFFCYTRMKVQPFTSNYWKISLGGILSMAIIFLIKDARVINTVNLILLGGLFMLIYGGVLWHLNVFDKEDKDLIGAVLKKFRIG